jgi:hypothetical protein
LVTSPEDMGEFFDWDSTCHGQAAAIHSQFLALTISR